MTEVQTIVPVSERADKPKRGTLLVVIEIDCANTDLQMIEGGFNIPKGVSQVKIPRRDLPKVMAMIETRMDKVAESKEQLERDIEEFIANGLIDVKPEEVAEKSAQLRAQFSGSAPARFRDLMKRDMLPFASVKIIEDDVLAEDDEEKVSGEEAMAARIAQAVASGMAGAQAPDIKALIAAEVKKAVDALTAPSSANSNKPRP